MTTPAAMTEAEQQAQALDHDAIMALIRNSQDKFRARPAVPDPATPRTPGFTAAPPLAAAPAAPELAPEPAPEPAPGLVAATGPDPAPLADTAATGPGFTPAPAPPELDLDALRAEAFAQGKAEAAREIEEIRSAAFHEGHRAGLEAAEADLGEARRAFLAATEMLTRTDGAVLSALSATMTDAILRLASDRAGLEIDRLPMAFAQRIDRAAARIARGIEGLEIHLNPADLTAIRGAVTQQPHLEGARLRPDPSLARGDLRLDLGDIGMTDILGDQL